MATERAFLGRVYDVPVSNGAAHAAPPRCRCWTASPRSRGASAHAQSSQAHPTTTGPPFVCDGGAARCYARSKSGDNDGQAARTAGELAVLQGVRPRLEPTASLSKSPLGVTIVRPAEESRWANFSFAVR